MTDETCNGQAEEDAMPPAVRVGIQAILDRLGWDQVSLLGVALTRNPLALGDLILDELSRRRNREARIP